MARKKRDFDYMELYNPDYRAMKANIFDGIVRDSHIETLSVPDKPMTNPFGQESAYNGTYKMDKLSYNDYDYQNMTPEAQQQFDAYNQQVKDNNKQYRQNQREARQEARQQEGGGFGMWGNVINGAANNMITAFTDPNMKVGDRVATILGMPNLAKNWRADTTKGDANLTEMTNRINNATNRLIQDSNDTQGAFAAIKNNNNLNLIDTSGFKTPTLKDFKGNWWKNTGVAMAQGAASGSIGGPWGAAGGAVTGLLGSIGGLFGRKKRAQRALDKYKDDMNYLQRFAGNFNSFQRLNQQQSNENLLNNGLKQQRIQDLANIRAYGGNLFATGGETDPTPSLYDVGTSPLGLDRMAYTDNRFVPKQLTPISYGNADPNGEWASAANYIADYDNQRMDLFHKNLDEINTYRQNHSQAKAGAQQLANQVINKTEDGRIFLTNGLPKFTQFDLAGTFYPKIARSNMSSVRIRPSEGDFTLNNGAGGIYRNPTEDMFKLRHTVTTDDNFLKNYDKEHGTNYYDTSKIHELAHSRGLDPFYEQLFTVKGLNKNLSPEKQAVYDSYPVQYTEKNGKKIANPNYWKTPTEVISRRYEARKSLDLNPRDIVTKEYLNKPEVKKVIKDNHLDMFTDDQLMTLFNEVADNNNSKQYDNVAAMGGQFDTFNLSPNMIDMQNQSLDNQKYKYINQMQPVGFTDGGAGKIPNPGIPRLACGGKLHLNKFDFGGSMNGMDIPTGMQSYENGGTHEENPNGGIQVGVDSQGTPNLVEEGEFRWGDYVFSNRIDVDLDVLSDFNVPATKRQGKKANKGKLSYADLARKMAKKAGDLNDSITKDTLNENMKRASQAQDFQKAQMNSDNQLADYKNALKNQTQGNPMYGSMKYNGMGNVNQGLNEGSSAMEGVDNSSLSNVNRSGNAMMAAYGGNLYPDGGNIIISNQGVEFRKQPNGTWMSANGDTWSDAEMQQFVDNGEATMRPIPTNPAIAVANDITKMYNSELSPRESYAQQFNSPTWTSTNGVTPMNPLYNIDVNLGFGQTQNGALGNGNIYNQQFGLGMRPDYVAGKNPNSTVEAVSTYGRNVNGQIQYDPNGKPVMLYPNTFTGLNGEAVNVDNKGFYQFGNTQNTGTGASTNTSSPTNGSSYSSTSSYSKTASRNQGTNENMPEIPPAESTQEGLPNSKDQAGIVDNRNLEEKHAQFATATTPTIPTLNTKGLYAQLGKGALKNIYNWAGLANTEFTPNNKPEQDLRALGRTGYVPRTADHSGMYRAADLFDINLANNASQAQAAATARAMRNVNDRNQGAANQLAADYNAMLGIGNNYQTMFNTNAASRRDAYTDNKQTEQTNVAVNNDMYRDNQQAGIQAKNFELSTNTAANQMQWAKDQYADTQNRIAALNKQSDAARMADNQINFLVDKAKENAYYNLKNKDPRQMYWNDPSTGEWYFKGDNGYYNNLRRAMSGTGINSLDTTSNEELAAMADQKGWNNITEEDMKDVIARQYEREDKAKKDKEAKDAQDLRNAKNQYMSRLLDIQRFDPDYKPDYSSYATTDDWLTGYNRLNTDYLRNEDFWKNMQLYDKQIELAKLQAKAYGGKIKTNKRNKNHSYDYMAI